MSSISIGRAGAICENDKLMQILPGSSDDAVLINASAGFGKVPGWTKDVTGEPAASTA
jgi:hypothetical protein